MQDDIVKLENSINEIQELRKEQLGLSQLQDKFKDMVFMLDFSLSMSGQLPDGKRAIEHLKDAVNKLCIPASNYISFTGYGSSSIIKQGKFIADINMGGTNTDEAIDYVKFHYPNAKRVCLISDGEPNSEEATIQAAERLGIPISVLFIGAKNSRGERFMKRLAQKTKGTTITLDNASMKELVKGVTGLLSAGGK